MKNLIKCHVNNKVIVSALLAGSIFASGLATAEDALVAADEYQVSCASCHGLEGKGDGNMAQFLTKKPTDLTMLSKSTGDGKYPFLKVFQIIDGRAVVSGHGDRAMPVWGDRYKKEVGKKYGSFGNEMAIRGRVLELVYYIQSIQQK